MLENIFLVLTIILTPTVFLILFTFFKRDKKDNKKWKTDYREKDPDFEREQEIIKEKKLNQPKEFRGKRGGKYTKDKTKEGRPYRRYF